MTHSGPASIQEQSIASKFTGGVLLLVFVAACLEPVFFTFLPNDNVSAYGSLVFWGSAAVAMLVIIWKWDSWKRRVRNRPVDMPMGKFLQHLYRNVPFVTFSIVLVIAVVAHLLFVRLVPHLSVLAMGVLGSQEFVVDKLQRSSKCRHGVTLRGQPFVADRVCGIPQDVHARIKPGSRVMIHGKKGWAGLIPESITVMTR